MELSDTILQFIIGMCIGITMITIIGIFRKYKK
jgi:hypothetical protein